MRYDWLLAIVARADSWGSIKRTLTRPSTTSDNLFLATWIGLIIAFWVGLYYFDKWRKTRSGMTGNAKSLFIELCKVHGLTRHERSLMLKAVRMQNLREPAVIFVDPHVLGQCASTSAPESAFYAKLSRKLFA